MSATARAFVVAALAISLAATGTLLRSVPAMYVLVSRASTAARNAAADACSAELALALQNGPAAVEAATQRLMREHELRSLQIHRIGDLPPSPPSPLRMVRRAGDRMIEVQFSGSGMASERGTVQRAATAAGIVFIIQTALLVLALVSLARPQSVVTPERRQQTGADDYLLQTFGASIQRLRGRETELQQLHDLEKGRADELATLTATLVRSLTSGFIALDGDDRIVDMNTEARQLLGIPASIALAGETPASLLGDTEFRRTLERAARERIALQRLEVEVGGETVKVLGLTTVPLLDERSRSFGMLALFTDLTPIRRLETRLRDMQSLAALGEMSAGIAHELRNSLSTIVGYIRLARRGSLSDETESRLRRADEEAQQLARAVESLLVFARPMQFQRQSVDLAEVAGSTVSMLAPLAEGIRFRASGEPVIIEGDALLLSRAVENILRNAVEAIHEKGGGGTVSIDTTAHPQRALVIADDGVGLDPADANRMLLPFQSTKRNGFGVGLALARKIVLLHGGTIELTGAPGKGATVTLEFPGDLPVEALPRSLHS